MLCYVMLYFFAGDGNIFSTLTLWCIFVSILVLFWFMNKRSKIRKRMWVTVTTFGILCCLRTFEITTVLFVIGFLQVGQL